jgi:hypothetical protein
MIHKHSWQKYRYLFFSVDSSIMLIDAILTLQVIDINFAVKTDWENQAVLFKIKIKNLNDNQIRLLKSYIIKEDFADINLIH